MSESSDTSRFSRGSRAASSYPSSTSIIRPAPGRTTPKTRLAACYAGCRGSAAAALELYLVTTDTKWIIGTIVPAVLVVAGLLFAQISGVDSSLNARIDDVNGRLERLATDVRSMDDRLRAVEVAFGKID